MAKRPETVVGGAGARPASATEGAGKPFPSGQIEVLVNVARVEVSPELEAAVHRAYKGLCEPLPTEMTTSQAADFLDVSRPFIIKLVTRGELPCRMVGKHRRIPTPALLEHREKMFQRARTATDEMAQTSQKLGLYELEGPPPKVR